VKKFEVDNFLKSSRSERTWRKLQEEISTSFIGIEIYVSNSFIHLICV
jgi:hypothetical protein